MTRVFIEQALQSGAPLELPEGAARHLVQVLRLRPGARFVVFNGAGDEYEASLVATGKRGASARIGERLAADRESPLPVTLAQCVSKGERMDYAIQKAVELGVSRIVPLLSSRSVVRLDSERWERKLEHWRGVMVSACEQSGRTKLPSLAPVTELSRWLDQADASALNLVLAPGTGRPLAQQAPGAGQPIVLLIGPEGGLGAGEILQAERCGFQAIALGPRILRTETAGVAALAALQALWGDWR